MKNVLNALSVILLHIHRNFSNYCLAIGILSILYFVLVTFGITDTILVMGILFVVTAFVNELNKSSRGSKRY